LHVSKASSDLEHQVHFLKHLATAVPSLPGDFNHDGTVDAADYVVWRKNPSGVYTQDDYNTWRTHFGQTAGSGSSANANGAVPEPASAWLLILAAAIGIWRASQRHYASLSAVAG
jgi:hypothetical protein